MWDDISMWEAGTNLLSSEDLAWDAGIYNYHVGKGVLTSVYVNPVDEILERITWKEWEEGEYILWANDWADHNIYGNEDVGLEPTFPEEIKMIDIVDEAVKKMKE